MRIIGGQYRGKKLLTPQDDQTRPTSDRVREDMFNILSHGFSLNFSGLRVLDLFSGTGALGLEALSRGADHVTFVENHLPALHVLKQNIQGFEENTHLCSENVLSLLKRQPPQPFDLVFMDPPYKGNFVAETLHLLHKNQWVKEECLAVIETDKKTILKENDNFFLKKNRSYGNTTLWFLEYGS